MTAWDGAGRPCAAEDRVPAVIVICEPPRTRSRQAGRLARDTAALQGHAGTIPARWVWRARSGASGAQERPGGADPRPLSRLVYDLNRSPDRRDAMPDRIETFSISANADLDAQGTGWHGCGRSYLPFMRWCGRGSPGAGAGAAARDPDPAFLHPGLARRAARSGALGIIHDDLPDLALRLAGAGDLGLVRG